MKFRGVLLLLLLMPLTSYAIVDMRNANFSDTWTDLIVPGSGYDLRVRRTYNSRTLFNGLFGFGWCSDFETTLEVTAESAIKVVECGGGMKLTYTRKNHDKDAAKKIDKMILSEVKKRNKSLKVSYLKSLEKRLSYNDVLRDELIDRLGFEGKIKSGVAFYANGRKNERIVLAKNEYTRTLADGTFQKFNKRGQMTHMYDRNGNFLKLSYSNDRLIGVVDNNGRKLTFSYKKGSKKVGKIAGPNGMNVTYNYKGEDLVTVKNAWKNTFAYAYDSLHNLKKITFPDKTTKVLTYNEDKDWVTSFTDRRGCKETYTYGDSEKDPLNHYWSTVEKVCGKEVTNKSRYEFIHKLRADGTRYLFKSISDNNGDKTEVVYHDTFGKPVSIRRNSTVTLYSYFKNGLLRTKKTPLQSIKYAYNKRCDKPSQVVSNYYQLKGTPGRRTAASKRKKVLVKTVKTAFTYDKKRCNLMTAKNSDGQRVKLDYDQRGRIAKITDQAKKTVKIKYEERFGKPQFVTRPGLGTIKVSYKPDGNIDKVDSKEGPQVAIQVASIFNNLLEIIAPASDELSI
jgi:YD repeat-containing protein